MSPASHPRNYGFAFFLIVLGSFLLADQLGYADFGYLIGTFWPLILIYLGLKYLIKKSLFGGVMFSAVGTVFLLQNLDLLSANAFRIFWPIVIIVIGIFVLFKPRKVLKKTRNLGSGISVQANEWADIDVMFAGVDNMVSIDPFVGGNIDATFSGVNLDLTQSLIAEQAILNINLAFSGLELVIPKDWKVVSELSPVAGSVSDDRRGVQLAKDNKELILRGDLVFSGINIKS